MSTPRTLQRKHSFYRLTGEDGADVFLVPTELLSHGGVDGEVMVYSIVSGHGRVSGQQGECHFLEERDELAQLVRELQSSGGSTVEIVKKLTAYRSYHPLEKAKYERQPGPVNSVNLNEQRAIALQVANYPVAGYETSDGKSTRTQRYFSPRFSGVNIFDYMNTPEKFMQVWLMLAMALEEMHQRGFIHGDFKPNNVCFEIDDEGLHVYIIDFGHSKQLGDNYSCIAFSSNYGSHYPPEIYLRSSSAMRFTVTESFDVYAFGKFIEDAARECGYQQSVGREVFANADLKVLRTAMLDSRPENRPTLKAVIGIVNVYLWAGTLYSGDGQNGLDALSALDNQITDDAIGFCIAHSQDHGANFVEPLLWLAMSQLGLDQQKLLFIRENLAFLQRMVWLICGVDRIDQASMSLIKNMLLQSLPELLDVNSERYQLLHFLYEAKLDLIYVREVMLSSKVFQAWLEKLKGPVMVRDESSGEETTALSAEQIAQAYALTLESVQERPVSFMTEKGRAVLNKIERKGLGALELGRRAYFRLKAAVAWRIDFQLQQGRCLLGSHISTPGRDSEGADELSWDSRLGEYFNPVHSGFVNRIPPELREREQVRAHGSMHSYVLGCDLAEVNIDGISFTRQLAVLMKASHPALRPSVAACATLLDVFASSYKRRSVSERVSNVQQLNFKREHVEEAASLYLQVASVDDLPIVRWMPFVLEHVRVTDMDVYDVEDSPRSRAIYKTFMELDNSNVWIQRGLEVYSKVSPLREVLNFLYDRSQLSVEHLQKLLSLEPWQVAVLATSISEGNVGVDKLVEMLVADATEWQQYQQTQAIYQEYNGTSGDRPRSYFKMKLLYRLMKQLVYAKVIAEPEEGAGLLQAVDTDLNGSPLSLPGSRSVAQRLVMYSPIIGHSNSKPVALRMVAAAKRGIA